LAAGDNPRILSVSRKQIVKFVQMGRLKIFKPRHAHPRF